MKHPFARNNLEQVFLFLFVFLLPSQLAYHFWPNFSYVFGLRVDYLAPAVYLTDVLFVFLIPNLISRVKKNFKKRNKILPIALSLLALVNIIFAKVPAAALFKWLVILKIYLVALYFCLIDLKRLRKLIYIAVSSSVVFFTAIGIVQFIKQGTLGGVLYYLGERTFTSSTPGIALVNFFGKSLMRAYSTFSHPNSLAAFMVVSFLVAYSLLPKEKGLLLVFSFVVISSIITFSLGSLVGVIFVVGYITLRKFAAKLHEAFIVYLPVLLMMLSLLVSFYPSALNNIKPFSGRDFRVRIDLAKSSIRIFSQRPLLGVGLNNSLVLSTTQSESGILTVQPVHNIYLLLLSETGILGVIFFYFLITYLINETKETPLFIAILFILITGLFDHYWLTLQQNILLLAMVIGLSLNKSFKGDKILWRKTNTE